MVVANAHLIRLGAVGGRVVRIVTNQGTIDVPYKGKVFLAAGTIENTRIALHTLANSHGLIGRNLMAHLRSNLTFRVKRSDFGNELDLKEHPELHDLQVSALFVKGIHTHNDGRLGHFHLQITASGAGALGSNSESQLFKKIPNIDELERFEDMTDDWIVIIARGIGEMEGDKTSHDGMPAWELFGSVRFLPSGETFHGALLQHYAEGSPGRLLDPPLPVPLIVNVPADANRVGMWFVNREVFGCTAWDSQFGVNYRFDVAQAGPAQAVMIRTGAEPSLEMVNLFGGTVSKIRRPLGGGTVGSTRLETQLTMTAWVQNASYQKNVWVDLHIFDPEDDLISAQTSTLAYSGSAEGNGDLFTLDEAVFQGSGGVSGSVWPRPDARRIQYRLYYEVDGRVFTDGILHQQAVAADAAATSVEDTAESIAA